MEGIWAIDNDRALAAKFWEMGENMTAAFEMEGMKEIKEWEIIPGGISSVENHRGNGDVGWPLEC